MKTVAGEDQPLFCLYRLPRVCLSWVLVIGQRDIVEMPILQPRND